MNEVVDYETVLRGDVDNAAAVQNKGKWEMNGTF